MVNFLGAAKDTAGNTDDFGDRGQDEQTRRLQYRQHAAGPLR